MQNKRKSQHAPQQHSVTEPVIVKRRLKPNYLGIVAVFLLLVALGLFCFALKPGWHANPITRERYYCPAFFRLARGAQTVDGELLCFDERGRLANGAVRVGGTTYLADENGRAVSGELRLEDGVYIAENGEVLGEFKALGNGIYEPVGAKAGADGTLTLGKQRYTLTDGKLRSGFVELDGKKYGYGEHGETLTGCAELDGATYLFGEDGRLLVSARRDGWASDENGVASKVIPLAAEGDGVMTPETFAEPSAELNEALDKILSEIILSDFTESETVRAVYDYICDNLYWGNENTSMDGVFTERLETVALSALERGDGRSQHYAALAYYMLNKLGYQTIVVKGQCVEPYGEFRDSYWCMTALEDGWYHLDAMCEDYDGDDDCFLVGDGDIKGVTHDWQAGSLPASA